MTVVRADVCHAVSNGLPALLALVAKWQHGTPMVMSEHGVYLRERYLAFSEVRYRWPVKVVLLALFRRLCWTAYAEADVIVPVNVYNQRWEVRHGADPDTIATAYNGVNPEAYPTAADEPGRPDHRVGGPGRPAQGPRDAGARLRPGARATADDPAAAVRARRRSATRSTSASCAVLVAELGLEQAVTFEGPVQPVTDAYHASTLVALSSISEGLPYTVIEAMMCRRATVSTEVGGVPEVVGETGRVVPPRDPAAFAAACVELLQDADRREAMAARAQQRARALFPLQRMLQAYGELYLGLSAPGTAPLREVLVA